MRGCRWRTEVQSLALSHIHHHIRYWVPAARLSSFPYDIRNDCKSAKRYGVSAMTIDELRLHLSHLINSHVQDLPLRARLLMLVATHDVPAKGILIDLEPFLSGSPSREDAKIIKDIAFYFC